MIPSDDFKICCDEKAQVSGSDIDLFADLDANSNPPSSFTIRDYVFDFRSKNIACNWPFSHKTLQTCLQYEVKNILPPFQSLESLRNNSSNEEIISSCSRNSKSNPELTLESRKSKKSLTHIQQVLGQTKSKKPVLGCSSKTETETAMGSKICPVCKVFSSSSNTTLNAHIDQCLSGVSSMKWTADPEVVIKHRIKPRKMKLMVDIYKTAPHCTVEDLDARNGTSWANDLSISDQEAEFQDVHEKEEPAATSIVDHEGDVYINNNRTKVRLLSVPKADNNTSNDDRARKKGRVFLGKKKNDSHEPKHDQKYLKQSPNSKKSSSEVENVDNEECCNKEKVDKDDFPIVRPPWACSKRTALAKKNSCAAGGKSFSKSGFKRGSISSDEMGIQSRQNSRKMGTLTPRKAPFAKKRSLLSAKPSSDHLKKYDSILQNGCEDPSYSCRVKGSVSIKTVSKINLKRKFSALRRGVDSLEQKSGVEEDTSGKTTCESMNLSEIKKNEKIEKMEICKPENSVSSRSFNEGSSRLKTCMVDPLCDVESVANHTRSNKEQASTVQVPRSSDNMFDSREHVIDVTVDIERQQQHYHDMSDSPVSTISNPSLTRSESDKFSVRSTLRNDEKHAPITLTSSGDWRPKDQSQTQSQSKSQTTSFKNDHQPCCCSRKEVSSPQTPASTFHDQLSLFRKHDVESFNFRPQMFSISSFPTSLRPPPPPPLPMKVPPYRECDSAASRSKSVIRLMGKDLTVVNTGEDKVNCDQFPNGYQNGFRSQHPTFHPPNSLKNNALDTMFRNSTYADYYVHGSPQARPMLPANQDPKNSLAFINGSILACSPFMEVENTNDLAKWSCKPAGSSRSSAIYYPSSFS